MTRSDGHSEAVREAALASIERNNGNALLHELHDLILSYVVLPSTHAAVAITLWIVATWAQPSWDHATRLVIKSPLKRCAKSRLQDVVSGASYRPLVMSNASVAAVFRSITEEDPPTIFLDECDAVFGKRQSDSTEELRGLLNAGFGRNRPALRCVGPKQEPTFFPTFAMACLAAIGDAIPDTVTDRAVNITMRRRLANEHVAQYREARDRPLIRETGDRVGAWVRGNLKALDGRGPRASRRRPRCGRVGPVGGNRRSGRW